VYEEFARLLRESAPSVPYTLIAVPYKTAFRHQPRSQLPKWTLDNPPVNLYANVAPAFSTDIDVPPKYCDPFTDDHSDDH
jgi:hypothetical protein